MNKLYLKYEKRANRQKRRFALVCLKDRKKDQDVRGDTSSRKMTGS